MNNIDNARNDATYSRSPSTDQWQQRSDLEDKKHEIDCDCGTSPA